MKRMLVDDWNEGLIYTWARSAMKECIEDSESVLNSAMAAWVFDAYARLLDFAGDSSVSAQDARKSADRQRGATRAQWNGRWFGRAWPRPKLGWLGDTTLWIEPQPRGYPGGRYNRYPMPRTFTDNGRATSPRASGSYPDERWPGHERGRRERSRNPGTGADLAVAESDARLGVGERQSGDGVG